MKQKKLSLVAWHEFYVTFNIWELNKHVSTFVITLTDLTESMKTSYLEHNNSDRQTVFYDSGPEESLFSVIGQ